MPHRCLGCGEGLPADAQFCPECGTGLAVACGGCGAANRPEHKFCTRCGRPGEPGPAPEPKSYTPRRVGIGFPHTRVGTILVVDDDREIRDVVSTYLLSLGYTVKTAENGGAALLLMTTVKPDLVLLDIAMPQMDGLEALERIMMKFPSIPVIMMTAFTDVQTTSRAFEAAAAGYVLKPFDLQHLERVVAAQMLRRSPASS